MQTQTIKRIKDASEAQGRVILTMSCGHFQFMSPLEYRMLRVPPVVGVLWTCQACPDLTQQEIWRRQETGKTATQLWKEAGEP